MKNSQRINELAGLNGAINEAKKYEIGKDGKAKKNWKNYPELSIAYDDLSDWQDDSVWHNLENANSALASMDRKDGQAFESLLNQIDDITNKMGKILRKYK